MADEKTFSHISVSTDEEDDFVIQAGIRATTEQQSRDLGELPGKANENTPSSEAQQAGLMGDEKAQEAEVSHAEKPIDSTDKKRDTYQETRLEDLESAPMSLAQKVIIALALVGVIAVAIYIVFLR